MKSKLARPRTIRRAARERVGEEAYRNSDPKLPVSYPLAVKCPTIDTPTRRHMLPAYNHTHSRGHAHPLD